MAPNMSSTRSLVDLPTELLQRVLLWTLFIDAQAELPLLLTCRSLKDQTESAANNGAWKYAVEHYGSLATMMFTPVPTQNLLHGWLPGLEQTMERMDEAMDGVRVGLEAYTEPLNQPSSPTFDFSTTISTIRVGLYFSEAMHFQRQMRASDVRKLPDWSLAHELLILRQTSSVIADIFGPRILHKLKSSDAHKNKHPVQILRRNASFMISAVEVGLLSHGTHGFVDIIRPLPVYPTSDGRVTSFFVEDVEPLPVAPSSGARLDALKEFHKRRNARSKALDQFLEAAAMLNMYQGFPIGPLQQKEKTRVISKSISANYGDEDVPTFPTKRADILKLLAAVGTAVEGMSETDILNGMKATMEI